MSIKLIDRTIWPTFPSMVFSSKIESKSLLNQVASDVMKLTKDETMGNKAGTVGWHSNHNLHNLPQFEELADLFLQEAVSVMDYMTVIRDESYLTSMWANVGYRPEYSHQNHIHPNSLLSGVLHVSMPPSCSGTAFSDPRPGARIFEPNHNELNATNSGVFIPKFEEGTLLIFPSYLPHGVPQTYTSYGKGKNRITISFNAMILGDITTRTAPLSLR
jgi:uncharacterized protein (TIGR02466 family)